MRIHSLNCISSCPLGGALMDARSGAELRGRLACHCLLIEADRSLVLVDTGFGLRDCAAPFPRLSRFFLTLLRPDFREEMTAVRQIQKLGFDPRDVRHIVLTHLDFDHAGGLDDFPWATVHLLARERDEARAQATVLDRMRYRPQQWSVERAWRTYRGDEGDGWFGFGCTREVADLGGSVLLVPLVGHTLGHAGVAIRRETDWLLMAGDAYFFHAEMSLEHPWCTPGLRFYQRLMDKDRSSRILNQERLRSLKRAHGGEVTIVSSHDPAEFERLAGRGLSSEVPGEEAAAR